MKIRLLRLEFLTREIRKQKVKSSRFPCFPFLLFFFSNRKIIRKKKSRDKFGNSGKDLFPFRIINLIQHISHFCKLPLWHLFFFFYIFLVLVCVTLIKKPRDDLPAPLARRPAPPRNPASAPPWHVMIHIIKKYIKIILDLA